MKKPEKTEAVTSFIRRRIDSGKWPPGSMIPAEKDLCSMLNASRVTIRRGIDSLVEGKILDRVKGSGTYVRSWATSGDIAVLLPSEPLLSPSGWTYQAMLSEAEKFVSAAGSRAHLALGYGTHSTEYASTRGVVDTLLRAGVGGAVCLNFDPRPFKDTIMARRLPTVALLGADVGWRHTVIFDYMSLARTAAEELKRRGLTEVTVMSFKLPEFDLDREVRDVFSDASKYLGSQLDVEFLEVPYSLDGASTYECFKRMWSARKRPRTVFFFDEFICDPATRAILELGIKVPDELSILTHSSLGRNFIFPVPLTRVCFDLRDAVRKSLGMLFGIMRSGDPGRTIVRVPAFISPGGSL